MPEQPTMIRLEENGVSTLEEVLNSDATISRFEYVPIGKSVLLADVATVFYIKRSVI
jgi:hypothetical protein